jgi:bacterial/archaeal transporter family-2 protein
MSQTLLTVLALVTGALIPFQLVFNAQMGTALKSPYLGAFFVFVVGVITLALLAAAMQQRWPSGADLAAVPRTAWLGGLIATAYIVAVVFLVPRFGVGSTAVLIIAGQLITALALDHFGAFGSHPSPAGALRMLGAGLVLLGASLVKFG